MYHPAKSDEMFLKVGTPSLWALDVFDIFMKPLQKLLHCQQYEVTLTSTSHELILFASPLLQLL